MNSTAESSALPTLAEATPSLYKRLHRLEGRIATRRYAELLAKIANRNPEKRAPNAERAAVRAYIDANLASIRLGQVAGTIGVIVLVAGLKVVVLVGVGSAILAAVAVWLVLRVRRGFQITAYFRHSYQHDPLRTIPLPDIGPPDVKNV